MSVEIPHRDYKEALSGQRITSVEVVDDETARADDLSGGYIIIRTENGHALYADAPTLFAARDF